VLQPFTTGTATISRLADELNAEKEFDVGQEEYNWMQSFYGTELYARVAPCLQKYGTVETREKRLLAFLNVL
jgi:hypothetical protein